MFLHNKLLLIFLIFIAGCVNYSGMKNNGKAITLTDISIQHDYKVPNILSSSHGWWGRFKDPQLDQLIQKALKDSPDILDSQIRVSKANYILKESQSLAWPNVDFSGYVQKQHLSKFGLIPPPFNGKTYDIGELGLNFEYDFDFWGKNKETILSKQNALCASEESYIEAKLIVSNAVTKTYLDLKRTIAILSITRSMLAQQEEIKKIIYFRFKNGLISNIPLQKAYEETQKNQQEIAQLEQAKEILEHQLAILIGNNAFSTTIEISNHFNDAQDDILPKIIPANILAQRPDIIAARFRIKAAANQVNIAKSRFFPNINLTALLSLQSAGLNHLFTNASRNNAITNAIDLPIFDANERRANLGEKYDEYDLALNEYNQRILLGLRQVADQLSILHSVKPQIILQNKTLVSARLNYTLINSKYKHGIIDYIDVIYAKKDLLKEEINNIILNNKKQQAIVDMIKALGGLESSDSIPSCRI